MKHSITWEEIEKARKRLSQENGSIIKDWGGKLPFAFVYPNSYRIGMSNLGLQTIYGLLNNREDVVCERVFWDQENREKGTVPLSVESHRPLTDFAVLAFSLNYEIDYFNIAPILRSSSIPLYSTERDESSPLIIAGGPCITANPMPVASFFDCLGIGEAEALLPNMLPRIRDNISGKRQDLLRNLSNVPGVYIPGCLPEKTIKRQWTKDLDNHDVHSTVLTGDTELHDLYLIEVQRGCSHGCRFCLVSNTFSPVRFHSKEKILQQAKDGLNFRKRMGLVGPAVTDHPQIEEILAGLLEMKAQFSLSSSRLSSLTPEILSMMVRGGLRSIALAPEAGSNCLRQVIRKGIDEDQILKAIEMGSRKGMQQLKLYFMVGLPREQDRDIQSIVDLTLAGKAIVDKQRSKTRLTLNISPFVPKAGTPFQWLPMAPLETISARLSFLKNQLANKGVQVKHESPSWSEVQAVLSRGDSVLTPVLADIEKETLPAWRQSVEKHQIDIEHYAHQSWDVEKVLSWSFIESGITLDHLKNELQKSLI